MSGIHRLIRGSCFRRKYRCGDQGMPASAGMTAAEVKKGVRNLFRLSAGCQRMSPFGGMAARGSSLEHGAESFGCCEERERRGNLLTTGGTWAGRLPRSARSIRKCRTLRRATRPSTLLGTLRSPWAFLQELGFSPAPFILPPRLPAGLPRTSVRSEPLPARPPP